MRILLIEDDVRLANIIGRVLKQEQHTVKLTHDGESGLQNLLNEPYDLAIVDWMLPKRDGPSICKAARNAKLDTALLLLTARGQVEDRVVGLDSGADDYLTKPFAFAELLARVRALSRRHKPEEVPLGADDTQICCGEVTLDLAAHSARFQDCNLDLTSTEWNLLELFARHPEQVLSRQQILNHVWSYDRDVQETMVDLYVSYLRRKLVQCGADGGKMIETVRGFGYKMRKLPEAGG